MDKIGLSVKIALLFIVLVFCAYFFNSFILDSVPAVYDNKGNVIAAVGMTRDEIISNMGKNYLKDEPWNLDKCFCYPVSSQNKIKTSFLRREIFGNYLKILFNGERVEEIYFFGYVRGPSCAPYPPLAIKINKSPYR